MLESGVSKNGHRWFKCGFKITPRVWIGVERIGGYVPRRFKKRSGGSRTVGPWWEYDVPFVGTFTLNKDVSLFGNYGNVDRG